MRILPVLLVLAACGSPEPPSEAPEAAKPVETAAVVDAQPAVEEVAVAEGMVTCDAFADHMMESVEKTASESDVLTPAQALEFGTAMVEGLRSGCKTNDRLGEFEPHVQCYMTGDDQAAWEACRLAEGGEAFNAYVTGLLASSIRLDAGVPE
ncbi:MAG: hypothetical protein ACJAZO_003244 [Myxococcota bacterium]|jgi:hypothetical protein